MITTTNLFLSETAEVHFLPSFEMSLQLNFLDYSKLDDNLGWIITLTNGEIFFEQSFDAWGRYRNPTDWTYTNIAEAPSWLRGYTGHEHLEVFALINMNGRMYDPILGRMLRPDNFVQDPLFSQSYNRYSYAWNNPLSYTDPDGEFVVAGIVIGAIIGAYIGGAMANNDFNLINWDFKDRNTWIGIGIGAVAGGAIGGVAGAGSLGILGKKAAVLCKAAAVPFKSGMLSGGLNAMYNYESGQSFTTTLGYFASGFAGGAIAGGGSVLLGMGISGLGNVGVHGMDSDWKATGREYAQKFVSGALSAYAGASTFGNVKYMKMANGDYFGGSKTAAKAWRAGWLNQASDFAHSSQDAFNKRSFGERLMMFGFAGTASMIAGIGEGKIDEVKNKYWRGSIRGLRQLGSGYFDYHMQQTVHSTFNNNPNYMPWQYKYQFTKYSITGYKSLFYGLQIH